MEQSAILTRLVTPRAAAAVKRRLVAQARRSLSGCTTLARTDPAQRGFGYFLSRDHSFQRAVTGLWGLGFQTDQIAAFIDSSTTEGIVLSALRSSLAHGHALLFQFLITGDLDV